MKSGSRETHSKRVFSDLEESEGESDGSLFSDEKDPEVKAEKRWEFSNPPEEDFSEYSGTDWAYQIIGEEVDSKKNVFYEVQWDDWHRQDGTNTTWATIDTSYIDHTAWKQTVRKARREQAKDSLEVELALPSTDIHNTETSLREEAYEEKLLQYDKQPSQDIFLEMAKTLAKHQEHHIIPRSSTDHGNQGSSSPLRTRASQRRTARQHTESSTSGSFTSTRKVSKHSVQTPAPVSVASSSKVSASFSSSTMSSAVSVSSESSLSALASVGVSPHKRTKRIILSDSDDFLSPVPSTPPKSPPPLPCITQNPQSQRKALGETWSALAQREGAASVHFVNDVDDEPVPQLDPSFVYIESSYQFNRGIQKPSHDFMVSCTCSNLCSIASRCECQTQLEVSEDQSPAYLPTGLYSFRWPDNLEIVECNKYCSCSAGRCANRVSQQPRRTPIEIFKTERRGWGVRSSRDVRKGQVLGLYTGLVMSRSDAMHLPDQEYHFALDHSDRGRPEHELYSVDSRLHGNWTRFMNHSCSPNTIIFTVVHDTPPDSGLPFIAFVAVKDIPAREEFTFDYSPTDSIAYHTKGKLKKKPKGSTTCHCGSERCRGYITSTK